MQNLRNSDVVKTEKLGEEDKDIVNIVKMESDIKKGIDTIIANTDIVSWKADAVKTEQLGEEYVDIGKSETEIEEGRDTKDIYKMEIETQEGAIVKTEIKEEEDIHILEVGKTEIVSWKADTVKTEQSGEEYVDIVDIGKSEGKLKQGRDTEDIDKIKIEAQEAAIVKTEIKEEEDIHIVEVGETEIVAMAPAIVRTEMEDRKENKRMKKEKHIDSVAEGQDGEGSSSSEKLQPRRDPRAYHHISQRKSTAGHKPPKYLVAPACTPPTKSWNPGQDEEIGNIINCGSDLDSDDDEEVHVPTGIPRTAYLYMETPTDPCPPVSCEAAPWMSDPMYDFQWLPSPYPPVPPQSRRETFTVNDVGPTVSDTTPVGIFKRIWDTDIMDTIVTETNRYAEQLAIQILENNCPSSKIGSWKDTTVEELYTFFGIILAMGVVIKSRAKEYWSRNNDIFSTPGFNTKMSLLRFQLLCRCLHFCDNSQLPRNTKPAEARIFKINPIIEHLNSKFQTMYIMGQNVSIDETLMQWRGWQIGQLIPSKAAVGIKTLELCESQTGYLWRFRVHSHGAGSSQTSQDPLSESTPSLVLELLEGLQHKGYTVWLDSFYNSPILARKLKKLGFDCVGTLRTNRQFVPMEIRELQRCFMKPGQLAGYTSGDVDLMVWRDQNRVAAISTYHGNTVTTDSDGNPKPALIRDFNTMVGGLDKKDVLLSSYPIERKPCRVWYKKLFRRLLNVSVLNSYIIHKKLTNSSMDHREFRYVLIKNLLQKGIVNSNVPAIFDLRYHYLTENPFGAGSSKGRLRRACKVCHKLTVMYCAGCNKSACLACFRELHLKS